MSDSNLKNNYIIVFSRNLIGHFIFFFFPLFFLSIGLNGLQTGILMGIFTITGLLFSFHVGIKTDRVRQKEILKIGVFLSALFCLGLVYFRNFWVLFILFFIGGLGKLLIQRTTETIVFKSTNKLKKGKELAIFQLMRSIPFIIGIMIGAYLIHFLGFRNMFTISFFLTLLMFIPVFKIKSTTLFHFPISNYFKDFKDKKVIYFCVILFIFCLHFGAEQVSYSPFIKYNLGLDLIHTSYFLAGVVVFLVLSALVTGKLVDKGIDRMKITYYAMLLSGIGGLLFASTNNWFWSFIFRGIHELGDGAFLVMISVGIVSLFGKKRMGGNSGFINLVIITSSFIGSLIFGPLGYRFGYQFPHIISGALSIIAFIMVLFFNKKFKKFLYT